MKCARGGLVYISSIFATTSAIDLPGSTHP